MTTALRRLLLVGLGLLAGAILPAAAHAQRTPPDTTRPRRDTVAVPIRARPDSMLPDSVVARDTTIARDSLMTPLARAPRPQSLGVGGDFVWDRDALFSTGATSLLDLLERVPGVSGFRTGWLIAPEHATYGGAFGRVRVFYDGVELDELNPRTGGLIDLGAIELWTLEEVAIERGAGELRVHLRSWRVQRTTPYTRTDVATGEYLSNLFRGFFGRRFRKGQAIQFGLQQFAADNPTTGGDGDQLALFGRLGWASGRWSVDGLIERRNRLQNAQQRRFEAADLPALEATRQLAYARIAYGSPAENGVWLQLLASSQAFLEKTGQEPARAFGIPADSADSTVSRAQYVATAGWTGGPLQLGVTGRLRPIEGERVISPSARASVTTTRLQAQLFAERAAQDSTLRLDAELRLTPHPRLAAAVGGSRVTADDETGREEETSARAELGARVGRTWLVGGVMTRRGGTTGVPVVYDPQFADGQIGTTTSFFGGIRGPVWRDVSAEVLATQWDAGDAGLLYRPEQQVRAQLTLDTRWLGRFPSGEFGFKASGILDYRSAVLFPTLNGSVYENIETTVFGGLVEIRLQDAVAFIQARNITGTQYEYVPGFLMPRNVIMYGVRWQFWN